MGGPEIGSTFEVEFKQNENNGYLLKCNKLKLNSR
jgi:hypothetical protein